MKLHLSVTLVAGPLHEPPTARVARNHKENVARHHKASVARHYNQLPVQQITRVVTSLLFVRRVQNRCPIRGALSVCVLLGSVV